MIEKKRIAKNTLFLYARMLLVMGITLYTSRIVLDKLGTNDYGLYNVIYGLIGMLSFLNGTLSIGTSRFITFELGKNNRERVKKTFSTALFCHIILAAVILLIGETVVLWYVNHVMVVEPGRMHAAQIVYQISILSTIIAIIQVPFMSSIMAHEEMDVYAFLGIFEAIASLCIVFLLKKSNTDLLILYAILIICVKLIVFLFYIIYTKFKFTEISYKLSYDKGILLSIMKFSGWNIIANLSNTLMSQGIIVLFNLFFLPVVAASQAITNQISSALSQFVQNIRSAVNPQIIKLYATQEYDASKRLTFISAEYIFYLLLLLGVPLILVMPTILNIWLINVPDYTVAFARLIVIQDILSNFSAAFYIPMMAANKVVKNSVASFFLCVLQFVLLYFLFSQGFGPLWARYTALFSSVIFSFIIKPYILWKDIIGYNLKEIYHCIFKCMKTMLIIASLGIVIYILIPQTTIVSSILVLLVSLLFFSTIIYFSIEKKYRKKMYNYLLNRF